MPEKITFQVGDTVLYEGWQGRAITKVIKVTPKGGIRVEYDPKLLFNSEGKYSSRGSDWGRMEMAQITKLTPEQEAELRKEFAEKNKIRKCRYALQTVIDKRLELSYEASVKILEILKSEGIDVK